MTRSQAEFGGGGLARETCREVPLVRFKTQTISYRNWFIKIYERSLKIVLPSFLTMTLKMHIVVKTL